MTPSQKYYKAHKEDYRRRNKLKRARIREYLHEYKANRPCMDCHLSYPHYAMDFDHRPEETKLCDPNRLASGLSWKKTKEEVAKCDVVCSNCHRFRTAMRKRKKDEN